MIERDDEKPAEVLDAELHPNNAGNEHAVKNKKRNAAGVAALEASALQSMLSTPNGRTWLRKMLFEVCGIMSTTENAAFDTNGLHFREGARSVGLNLQNECVTADAGLYAVLLHEHFVKDV